MKKILLSFAGNSDLFDVVSTSLDLSFTYTPIVSLVHNTCEFKAMSLYEEWEL